MSAMVPVTRLQQQPAADHRPPATGSTAPPDPGKGQPRRGPCWPPWVADQQQLHRHQGGLGGGPHALELGQAEELQQAEVHDHRPRRR
jgi:hypothetical protein